MGEKAKTTTPVTVPRLKLDQKSPKKQLKERPKSSSSSIDEVLSQSTTSKDGQSVPSPQAMKVSPLEDKIETLKEILK